MTSAESENFRHAILRILAGNPTRFGLPSAAILLRAQTEYGIHANKDQYLDEIAYLTSRDPALAEEALKSVSKENRAWRITDAGRRYLDERSL